MQSTVGWNLFHALSKAAGDVTKKFSHIIHDLGPALGPIAMALGVPPEFAMHLTALTLAAHAGDKKASHQLSDIRLHGGAHAEMLKHVEAHVATHPHFQAFHAQAERARAHA